MLEARGQRVEEASTRVREADAETMWAMIQDLAARHDYPMASQILALGRHEHWTVMHTALVLAYMHMSLSHGHGEDLKDMLAFNQRPMVITNTHCMGCNCADKTSKVDNG
jgi:hypothetical protein